MTIFIAGLGVMGASYAEKLHALGHSVYGYDTDEDAVRTLSKHGIIKETKPRHMASADLIVLAMPHRMIVPFIDEFKHHMRPGSVVTDIAGIKTPFLQSAYKALPEGVDYVSHHPMAGKEKAGATHRDKTLFEGKNVILITPSPACASNIKKLYDLLVTMGFKAPVYLDETSHDRAITYTSQIPHVLALSLIEGASETTMAHSGNSFKDLTRIARIHETLWTPLFKDNDKTLSESIDGLIERLENFKQTLNHGDESAMRAYLRQIKIKHETL